MYFTLQRYKFSSKSQHAPCRRYPWLWCILPCKGTNFQANHNPMLILLFIVIDVFYLAKVQIFKQITTVERGEHLSREMCFTLQRYKFSSKSQRQPWHRYNKHRCVLPCKGTNFQANHNLNTVLVVLNLMCFTLQRYKFSSKSQLIFTCLLWSKRCVLPCKGTNFQANHNG